MTQSALLVTGASGKLGRRVVELLLEARAPRVIATTRYPERLQELSARGAEVRRADFDVPASLVEAFRGVERAALISTDALDTPGHRVRQHLAAVRALAAAEVRHVVYTSLPGADRSRVRLAPDHAETEAALRDSGLDFTVLRNNLYMELLLGVLPRAIASGQLIDARSSGKVAYVAREDCARVVAAALLDGAAGRRTLDVTGPQAIDGDQLAALVTELLGRPVRHVSVPVETLVRGMVEHGLPEPVAEVYASFDVAIAAEELGNIANTVRRLTGKEPTSLHDFLRERRDLLLTPMP